ncbi:hypothetical protein [Undibacterium luofuense]|uniref:Uncharacterized protein n=1 Tax=Undibacterium luofuense TaxID=2828733 RepID=A0A941DLQ2_9BURK|nr:hypothetical protein [Undibacterium luofuense]MBR7782339.1 hypothetical protein [Undibacterium luofuense]
MPYQSTHNYSTNWLHLRNILGAYPIFERNSDIHSLKEHLHANAMAVFLARATLATPVLDRKTVAEVLSGQLKWPTSTNVSHFKGATIPLSFLEDNGFVSFYAGWLNVHCCTPKNLESLHPSLVPLIEAINHLKDILYGRNGYIKAHYICKAQDFEESLSNLFGGVSAIELLPILHLENGYYHFPPGKENFNPLVSTYLWNEFNKMDPVQAFKNWITCLRVNCESAIPVLFELDKNKERTDFNEQLAAWVANDSALQQTVTVLQKQSQNEQAFQHIVSPVLTRFNINININSDRVTDPSDASETIDLEKHTLNTLSSAYFLKDVDGLSNLHSVKVSSRSHWREPNLFYTWLLAATVEASIHVDGQTLVSSGYPEAILELAMSRPVLKHMLLNALPSYESAGYKIFLLSRPATCNVALFYLTQRLLLRRNRNDSPAMQLIEKGFSQMVRDEYLRTIEAAQDVGELLLEIVESLSEEINFRASDFSQSPEYRILIDILDNLNYKHVTDLSHSLDNLISQANEDSSKQPKHHYFYLLGFWLIDRLDNAGIDSTGSLSKSIKDAIFNLYESEFNDNLTGKYQTLEPSAFFSTLPWHKLFLTDNVGL